jgi:multiple sugar transport system ATP-binding protein
LAEIKLESIHKNFDEVSVIKGVDIEIHDGEFVVFVGPSGSGKSTLLRMIAGLEDISSGLLMIDGEEMNDVPPSKRELAMVFQSYALYPHMSVFDNLAFGLKLAKVNKSEIKERVEKVAEVLQIHDYLERLPKQLSGGQRQRVAIGRAIIREPKVFLFDEPLSNLDAKLRVDMRREIKKLHKRLKTTIVYVTHDQTEAMSLGTNIAIMDQGKIQQCDTPKNIYNKPENMFVADFIGSPSMNLIEGILKDKYFMPKGSKDIKIPLNEYSFKDDVKEERPIYLGIRPEHVYFEKINQNCFEINLKSELVEYTGHEQIITFDYLNQQLLGKFSSVIDIQMDKDFNLNLDLNQISLFDKETRGRI